MNGSWQKIALVLLSLLITITLGWTTAISAGGKKQNERIRAAEENIRNIHHEKQVDRELLRQIDRNTGGDGNAPDVRPLVVVR